MSRPFAALTAALILLGSPVVLAAPAKTAHDYALIEAAYGGQLNQVQTLLRRGASVTAQDENGYTALHWAAQSGWPLTAKLLLDKGAAVNARDKVGRTPLLLAVVRAKVEVVRLLMQRGADPNIADVDGNTAAGVAQQMGSATLMGILANRATVAVAHPVVKPTAKPIAPKTPKPVLMKTPPPMVFSTPRPLLPPVFTPVPTPSPVAVVSGTSFTLGAHFREELGRLYGLYTDHLGLRDPENLAQRGYNQDLEDRLEQIFSALEYGSSPTLPRTKLQDARTWLVAARKRANEADAAEAKVPRQLLESLDQLLANNGF